MMEYVREGLPFILTLIGLVFGNDSTTEDKSRQLSQTQGLDFIPGLGYVDTISVLLLASIPVLVLIGLGSFLTPLYALAPAYLSGALNKDKFSNLFPTTSIRLQRMMQEKVVKSLLDNARHRYGANDNMTKED